MLRPHSNPRNHITVLSTALVVVDEYSQGLSRWCRSCGPSGFGSSALLGRIEIPAIPPSQKQGGVLLPCILPDEVTSIDPVHTTLGKMVLEILGVGGRNDGVPLSGNDLYGRQNVRKQVAEHT